MNTYKKFAANVFVAQTEDTFEQGAEITLTTRRGKENIHIVHNHVGVTREGLNLYSITRADGLDSQERARRKAERIQGWAAAQERKSNEFYEKSNEHSGFLSLGEPIKVGHHSERRHRKIIDQAWNNMGRSVEARDKAEEHRSRAEYWEGKAEETNLSMPESLEFYQMQLKDATEYHRAMKEGEIERSHSYSLTYAKKRVNELTSKAKTAQLLWG